MRNVIEESPDIGVHQPVETNPNPLAYPGQRHCHATVWPVGVAVFMKYRFSSWFQNGKQGPLQKFVLEIVGGEYPLAAIRLWLGKTPQRLRTVTAFEHLFTTSENVAQQMPLQLFAIGVYGPGCVFLAQTPPALIEYLG